MGRTTNGKKLQRADFKLERKTAKTDTALESAGLLVTTIKTVGSLANVPFLSNAAELASSILTMVQNVRDNKSEFEQLATEAFQLVRSITEVFYILRAEADDGTWKKPTKGMRQLAKDLKQLLETLKMIEDYAHTKIRRNMLQRLLYHRYDIQTIRQYRTTLTHAYQTFQLRSSILLRNDVSNIDTKSDEILERLKRMEEALGTAPMTSPTSNLPALIAANRPSGSIPQNPPQNPSQNLPQNLPPSNPGSPAPIDLDNNPSSSTSQNWPFGDPNFPFVSHSPQGSPHPSRPGASPMSMHSAGGVTINNSINSHNKNEVVYNAPIYNYGQQQQQPQQLGYYDHSGHY
ncbi:hypothetical protein D9611_002629 [Ephemerocybe angulata]|uniref:RPW8 domain-containing protein n=1 Tax=Ephemerocybe angulata TaxID=980116 RepID=A0A8H5C4C8_9AGAR|nr:hypothetical protein D9611_002629 [Tulosesus angulatus]